MNELFKLGYNMCMCVGCHLSFLLENIFLHKNNNSIYKNILYIFNMTIR